MPSKSKGRHTHVSDFVGPEGRLNIIKNDIITKDARKIIYPGTIGDPWWDTKQLLQQIDDSIIIFEEKHPNKVAVFVFNQSSAHAGHGERALNAFATNSGECSIVLPQKDTYFPGVREKTPNREGPTA
jgi:hypothetical protein